jgi:hypothetical protein
VCILEERESRSLADGKTKKRRNCCCGAGKKEVLGWGETDRWRGSLLLTAKKNGQLLLLPRPKWISLPVSGEREGNSSYVSTNGSSYQMHDLLNLALF